MDNFGLLDKKMNLALNDQSFLLPERVEIEEEYIRVYGSEVKIADDTMKLLFINCDSKGKDFFLYFKLGSNPAYGLSLSENNSEIHIKYDTSNKWVSCSMLLKASVLAGLEAIKDIYPTFKQLSSYKENLKDLFLLINENAEE